MGTLMLGQVCKRLYIGAELLRGSPQGKEHREPGD